MIYPSADTIEDKVGSRYSLVVIAAKRAKQIKEGAPVLIDTASTNPLTIALEEIAAGKVTVAPLADGIVPTPNTETVTTQIGANDGISLDASLPANATNANVDDQTDVA